MVLKTDSYLSRKILESSLELVDGAIRVLARFLPIIQVDLESEFSVEMKGHLGSFADEPAMVPLANGFGVVTLRCDPIVKGCIKLPCRKNLVGLLLKPFVVHQLNFEAPVDRVVLVAAVKDTRVGSRRKLVLDGKLEIGKLIFGPEVTHSTDSLFAFLVGGLCHPANDRAVFFDLP